MYCFLAFVRRCLLHGMSQGLVDTQLITSKGLATLSTWHMAHQMISYTQKSSHIQRTLVEVEQLFPWFLVLDTRVPVTRAYCTCWHCGRNKCIGIKTYLQNRCHACMHAEIGMERHTAADRTSQPCMVSCSVTRPRRPASSQPASSNTVVSTRR